MGRYLQRPTKIDCGVKMLLVGEKGQRLIGTQVKGEHDEMGRPLIGTPVKGEHYEEGQRLMRTPVEGELVGWEFDWSLYRSPLNLGLCLHF